MPFLCQKKFTVNFTNSGIWKFPLKTPFIVFSEHWQFSLLVCVLLRRSRLSMQFTLRKPDTRDWHHRTGCQTVFIRKVSKLTSNLLNCAQSVRSDPHGSWGRRGWGRNKYNLVIPKVLLKVTLQTAQSLWGACERGGVKEGGSDAQESCS